MNKENQIQEINTTINSKIWVSGSGTKIISIPKTLCRVHELENGDILEVFVKKVIKIRENQNG